MENRIFQRPSTVVRFIATAILTTEAFALIGLYVVVLLFGNGIGPEEPGAQTASMFGMVVVATAIYLPLVVMFFLTAIAVLRIPSRRWQRRATLVALVAITMMNAALTVLSIMSGLLIWALMFGVAIVALSAATVKLFKPYWSL